MAAGLRWLGETKNEAMYRMEPAIQLRDARADNMIYGVDLERILAEPGVYIFGRRYGRQFEALYVGKAGRMRSRVRTQLNNLSLMQHVRYAKAGKRILIAGRLVT
ncbi:MAG TPA: hypothetical protein VGH51_01960 [Candidatus Angelobacter sp.]